MIDLNKGGRLATYIEPTVDGVFRRDTGLIVNKNIFIHRNQNLKTNLKKKSKTIIKSNKFL